MVQYIRQPNPRLDIAIASAAGVAEQWARVYPKGRWPDKDRITDRLIELGDEAAPDVVANAIGNTSWTHPRCASCGESQAKAAAFSDGDSYIALCEECLRAALTALAEQNEMTPPLTAGIFVFPFGAGWSAMSVLVAVTVGSLRRVAIVPLLGLIPMAIGAALVLSATMRETT